MPTGDSYVALSLKRFLSQNRMSANWLDYTVDMLRDGISRIFPASGLFTFPVTITQDGAASTIKFTPDPVEGIDNAGRVLKLEGTARTQGIPYENTLGDDYWLAMHYIEVPDGVYANPRTGVPEYDKWKEDVGERDNPTSVSDDGDGTFTVNVDSLFPDGADHTGREVMVWLVNPMSSVESVAIETLTVYYSGGNLIASGGDLGQSTISTNVADYQVALVGVSIYNAGPTPSANPFTADYCILGFVTGGNPGSNDNSDQTDLSGGGGHTLEKAYDGLSGSGSGRTVTIDSNAIQLRKGSTGSYSHDISDAALRIRGDLTTALPGTGFEHDKGIDITQRFVSGDAMVVRVPLADYAGGDKLRIEETVSLVAASDTISFTRGGSLDLTLSGNVGQIIGSEWDKVEVSGSSLGQNGVYLINTVASASTLTVLTTDGSTPSFSAEAGLTARVHRDLVSIGKAPYPITIVGPNDFYEDTGSPMGAFQPLINILVGTNTDDDDRIFKYYRDAAAYVYMDADGDLSVSKDIVADGNNDGTGDFKYGGARSFTRAINMALGQPADESLAASDSWKLQTTTNVWVLTSDEAGGAVIHFPISLPDGATLQSVEVHWNPANTATDPLELEVRDKTVPFGTTSAISQVQLGAGQVSVTSTWETITEGSLATVADRDNHEYVVLIRGYLQSDTIGGIRYTYTMEAVQPSH